MKRIILIVVEIVLTVCLNACAVQKAPPINIIGSDVSCLELISNEYNYSDTLGFLNKKPDMDKFNSKYKADFYKQFSDFYYTVIKTEKCPIVVCFDTDKKFYDCREITFSDDNTYGSLKDLKQGTSLVDVMKADPKGDYAFIYSGWSEYPKVSYHVFKNGTVYLVNYDSSDKVASVAESVL